MRLYELRPSEIDEALEFRNSIFSRVDRDHFTSMRCTGVVARADSTDTDTLGAEASGRIVGFIPLQYRSQLLRPGLAVPVVYENAVGVDGRYRSRGIGGRMIDCAAGFMADRADALFVIRGGEATEGYRFYRKSGHSDLCHAVSTELAFTRTNPEDSGVREVGREEWLSLEESLNRLHEAKFGAFGGGRSRGPGYWSEILDGHVFRTRPWRLLVASNGSSRRVTGYAISVRGTWRDFEDEHLYEITADDETTAGRLIAAANREGVTLRVPSLSLGNPILRFLRERGFTETRSEPQIMARVIAPARLFSRLAAQTQAISPSWDGVRIVCSTPHRTFDLKESERAERVVALELKEHLLARMLCCRLDLTSAVEQELIRIRNADSESVRTLAAICRPAPWMQWYTDYV